MTSGGSLSVSWTVPTGQSTQDWIGLHKVGDPDTTNQWWQYTGGTTTGTLSLTAPTTAGDYEFRYFLNNGYTKKATSATVTVTSGSSSAANLSNQKDSNSWFRKASWFSPDRDAEAKETKSQATEVTKYTYDGLDVVQDDNSVNGITKCQNGLGIDNKLFK